MSAPSDPSFRSSPWQPLWFLVGFALALGMLVVSGRRAQQANLHPDFIRFHPMISPETLYQPTLDEMKSLVRTRTRPDQILVIVGGNSILNGVAQSPGRVWSERLQEALGDGYSVVNLSMRGGMICDGAAVVSEILRDEFPKQILVANTSPMTASDPMGSATYRYLLRSAWDRGLLEEFPTREARFAEEWPRPWLSIERPLNLLDAAVGYRSFWNRVALEKVSTMRIESVPRFPEWLKPRLAYGDQEIDGDQVPVAQRYRADADAIEMEIVRGTSALTMHPKPDGTWGPTDAARDWFLKHAELSRPPGLRPKTLVVIGQNSPYYLQKLNAEERARDREALLLGLRLWEKAGYAAVGYYEGFTEADYWDRTHLTPNGGAKLATLVAAKIKTMSKELGYE